MRSPIESTRRLLALLAAVRRARRAPFDPFKLTWIVTERCSLHCRTCQLWAGEPHAGPDLATVAQVVAANPQLTWLNLSGGDLVERPDAPALLALVARGFPNLALLDFPTAGQDTEGTLAALEPLLDSPIPRLFVTVSLDGPDELHDRLRGRRGAAAAARTTLRRLQRIRRRGLRVVAGLTLSRFNLPRTLQELQPDGVALRDVHLNLAHESTHYYRTRQPVAPPAEPALAVIRALQRKRWSLSALNLIERRYWSLAARHLATGDSGQDCGALRASLYLSSDLTVYPCTIFDRPLGRLADVGYALRRVPELPGAAAALGLVERRQCPRCWSPCEAFPTLLLHAGRSR
ncbi:MAG: hypothetical protein ACT4PU_02280 [Planctomycetota bacterium]